jgi:hypothetical protein
MYTVKKVVMRNWKIVNSAGLIFLLNGIKEDHKKMSRGLRTGQGYGCDKR